MFLFQSKMAAPSNPEYLFLQTADQSTTAAPTPPKPRQGYGPNEIVKEIFSYLDFRERARCASVCKQWHEIADDDLAYRRQYRLDILDRKSQWEPTPPHVRTPFVCKSCHRDITYPKYSRAQLDQRHTWEFVCMHALNTVCICCRELRDRDLAYLRHWRPDIPGRTIMWPETPPQEGWKKLYIDNNILHFNVTHDRIEKSKPKLEAYANRPVIPYHEKNAGIEDRWKRKTNENPWKVEGILQGAKKWRPIPRWKLWRIAESDNVSYHVEFELACRGYMRSWRSYLWSAIEL